MSVTNVEVLLLNNILVSNFAEDPFAHIAGDSLHLDLGAVFAGIPHNLFAFATPLLVECVRTALHTHF